MKKTTAEKEIYKNIYDKNKIINYLWYCAAAKHQSYNFDVAVHYDDDDDSG